VQEKGFAIETATKKKGELKATMVQMGAEIVSSGSTIEDLAAAIATTIEDLAAAIATTSADRESAITIRDKNY